MPENAKHKEREPKPFPQYDDAAHIDSAAVAPVPPWTQDEVPRGDPARRPIPKNTASPARSRGGRKAPGWVWRRRSALRTPAPFFSFHDAKNPRFLT